MFAAVAAATATPLVDAPASFPLIYTVIITLFDRSDCCCMTVGVMVLSKLFNRKSTNFEKLSKKSRANGP